MPKYLFQFLDNIAKIDVHQEIQVALIAKRDDAIQIQKDQLFSGVASDGSMIGTYAATTIRQKKAKGQPYDRVTGKDKGSMYNGLFLDVTDHELFFASTSSTYPLFTAHYGDRVFGLTPKNAAQYGERAKPVLIESIRGKL